MAAIYDRKNEIITSNRKFLSDIKVGEKVKIVNFHDSLEYKSLLLGMGILPGDEVEVTNKSPFGSPISFKHSESNFFALRKNQAKMIEVE